MNRKGFHRITTEQTRTQLIDALHHLRDYAISRAKETLNAGDWRRALMCLGKAAMYDDQSKAAERGEELPRGY